MFNIESAPTCGGALTHLVTTANAIFAFTLYELALDITIEPSFRASDEVFTLEFTATVDEVIAMLESARRRAIRKSAAP